MITVEVQLIVQMLMDGRVRLLVDMGDGIKHPLPIDYLSASLNDLQNSVIAPAISRLQQNEPKGELTCVTCGRIHPRNVATSHHIDGCLCGSEYLHAPDGRNHSQAGCIWSTIIGPRKKDEAI